MFEWAVELVSSSCDKTRNTTNSSLSLLCGRVAVLFVMAFSVF